MPQSKFLDSTGLQYLIGKLKTQFLAKGITSISFDNIDNIKNLEDTYEGKPLIYAVTKPKNTSNGSVNVFIGILEIIGDDMSHVVTQILTTHCLYNADTKQFDFSAHTDDKIYKCYRSYNVNSPNLTSPKGAWTDWNPFIDATIQSTISILSRKVIELETKITNLQSKAVTLGDDGKIKSSQFDFKLTKRRNNFVIYLKKSDQISGFLAFLDASTCCIKFEDVRVSRDYSNINNRLIICDQYNYKKSIDKANVQIEQIKLIDKHLGIDNIINEKVQLLCKLRLKDPEASYADLSSMMSEELNIPVSKSNIGHSFRKIENMAKLYEKLK